MGNTRLLTLPCIQKSDHLQPIYWNSHLWCHPASTAQEMRATSWGLNPDLANSGLPLGQQEATHCLTSLPTEYRGGEGLFRERSPLIPLCSSPRGYALSTGALGVLARVELESVSAIAFRDAPPIQQS
ncbi:hypothetical protein KIL84_008006 [Mauremys mutica]|uniref:Uncharacterized protein n=1 Tax=Mauremys mutica TaxID=74926 RepID=A0A9D3X3T5_9SAUR|nr:hypothetical protein KIL84_008006 [Mauremys mutica]